MNTKIDFDEIKRNYPLPDIVEASNVKLRKSGQEFWGHCPFHGEKTESFHLYQPGGQHAFKFCCFGCGEKGDIFDYVQEIYSTDLPGAVEIITGNKLAQPAPRKYVEAVDPYDGYDLKRPPKDTPAIGPNTRTPPILNPKRLNEDGKPRVVTYTPSMTFPYKDRNGNLLGYVLRVEFDDKKITPGVWWMQNKKAKFKGWSHGVFPEPRPLYGLDHLAAEPDAQVLLVEGEKCADAGNRLMAGKRVVCLSWMGGGKSISKSHWKSLKGRSVILWPDNDAEGWNTMLGSSRMSRGEVVGWNKGVMEYLFEVGVARVKVVHITSDSRVKGWDIADAEQEGLDGKGVGLIIKDRIREWSKAKLNAYKKGKQNGPQDADPSKKNDDDEPPPPEPNEGRAAMERHFGHSIDSDNWHSKLILNKDGDALKASSLQNIALMLQFEPRFSGTFAWNEFAQEVYLMRRPIWDIRSNAEEWKPRMVQDNDVTSATCWLEYCGLSPKTNDVGKVIGRVAHHNSYNPVTDTLAALDWDGIPRINGGAHEHKGYAPWMTTYLGAEDSEVNLRFGSHWLIGAVARAFQPGCKMDNMLILEGPQDLKKSGALRVLASAIDPHIFTDEMGDPNSKDAALQMQGAFIVEIAELDSFRKAEITQIKAWLTRQVDRFRRPYGKIIEEFPRSCVFAGTVNPSGTGYLKDATGGRRFWPVECTEIDLEGLTENALQIWAEAVHLYRAGKKWWLERDEAEEAAKVQAERYEIDPWSAHIDEIMSSFNRLTIDMIMRELGIPKERQTNLVAKRIGSHLHHRRWVRQDENGKVYFVKPTVIDG